MEESFTYRRKLQTKRINEVKLRRASYKIAMFNIVKYVGKLLAKATTGRRLLKAVHEAVWGRVQIMQIKHMILVGLLELVCF